MLVRYFDPSREVAVNKQVIHGDELVTLLESVAKLSSERGVPAVELNGDDGSALMVAAVLGGAALLWSDGLGSSYHNVGDPNADGLVVFDYFGSYTEVPHMFVVNMEEARRAAVSFLETGRLVHTNIIMEPD